MIFNLTREERKILLVLALLLLLGVLGLLWL